MKFFEFGKENDRTLLIECGYLAKWYPGLMPFIKEAEKQYHVIVQAYDGFNEDEPDKVFHSIMEEARMASDFIVENLGGKIDVLYGISLGGMVGNEILYGGRVKVHTFIADGYTIMPMPTFRSKLIEKAYVKGYTAIIYSALTKHQKILARILGRTEESFNLTDSYVFHGHAELIHKDPKELLLLIDDAYNV